MGELCTAAVTGLCGWSSHDFSVNLRENFNYMGRKRKPSNDHMDRKSIRLFCVNLRENFNYMGRKRKPSNDHMDRKSIRLFCVGRSN